MTAPKKPSQPWRVKMITAGSILESKYRSEPATYRAVAAEKERIANGASRVTRIRVEKWNVDYGRWEHFEPAYPEKP
ncbi:MAG TPA: hypothetical protein VK698_39280 [Kofleriaceae bacterium]|nr:hypothetical protein [Kofleriaceae bacterium]